MTGLNLTTDALIEIAVLVTDSELNVLGEGVDVVIRPKQSALDQMHDVVRAMHTTSRLLEELPSGVSMAEAEKRVMDYLRHYVPEPGRAPLAGNSVGTDRMFLARDMPAVVQYLHYRIIDVSTIKELARRWFPRAYDRAPTKHGGHRAFGDIKDSIEELRYYRQAVFLPAPSSDSAMARAEPQQFGQPEPPIRKAGEHPATEGTGRDVVSTAQKVVD